MTDFKSNTKPSNHAPLQHHQAGFSLLSTLLAVLLFAIGVIGLLDFQSLLTAELSRAQYKLQAERTAFMLLDVYPAHVTIELANQWQYQIHERQYNAQCKIVTIKMSATYGDAVIQQRWYCH